MFEGDQFNRNAAWEGKEGLLEGGEIPRAAAWALSANGHTDRLYRLPAARDVPL
jgi:hypothetical protein